MEFLTVGVFGRCGAGAHLAESSVEFCRKRINCFDNACGSEGHRELMSVLLPYHRVCEILTCIGRRELSVVPEDTVDITAVARKAVEVVGARREEKGITWGISLVKPLDEALVYLCEEIFGPSLWVPSAFECGRHWGEFARTLCSCLVLWSFIGFFENLNAESFDFFVVEWRRLCIGYSLENIDALR